MGSTYYDFATVKYDATGGQESEARSSGPESGGPTELEYLMLQMINRVRRDPAYLAETGDKAGPLAWDESLAQVARAHSADMISRGFFNHVNPDEQAPHDRVSRAGIPWESVAENIASSDDVEKAQTAFMNEPPFQPNHRANILNPDFTHIGVGIVQGPNGRLFITQVFRQAPTALVLH